MMLTAFIGLIGVIIGSDVTTIPQWIIAKRERADKFRLAALEKRLAIHQEAYAIWLELLNALSEPLNRLNVVVNAEKWWWKNCLYLDQKSRGAFRESYVLVDNYENYVNDSKEKEVWEKVTKTGEIIVRGVGLSPMEEEKRVKKDKL